MALKKFIGARYAPEFAGAWSNTKQYAALSVVYTSNRSYVSRKTVPAGTPITNTEFWIQSSDWNAQVAEYNLKVEGYNANVEQYNKNVQDYSAAVSGFYADTLHSFDTKADMQADRTLALGETLLTCGDKKIGDGGGSFYQVVSETSVTAVALDNGLFAEPFEFQPYDYSQFQQEVEGYKNSTTRVYNVQKDMVADTGINTGNVLMTTGGVAPGDGRGAFWNVGDTQTESSIPLNNGKYATPFTLTSVDISGDLVFNNKSSQVSLWGLKAGGSPITINVNYNQGETRTVYVAVEYTSDNTNATVNVAVNGASSFTKSFAWSDATAAPGQAKTVLYAITIMSSGNNVYTGSQIVTSYLTTLEKFTEKYTVYVTDEVTAKSAWTSGSANIVSAPFTVNSTIELLSFTAYPSVQKDAFSGYYYILNILDKNDNSIYYQKIEHTNANAKLTTFAPHNVLKTDGNYQIILLNPLAKISSANSTTGNYGVFSFNNARYAGTIVYQAINIDGTSNVVPSFNGTSSSNDLTMNFTVNQKTYVSTIQLSDFNVGVGTLPLNINLKENGNITWEKSIARENVETTATLQIERVLYPGVNYSIILWSGTATITTNAHASSDVTASPFTFKAGDAINCNIVCKALTD
nr:MAG TPA: hypothetical protein [Caudoviricetes sp.]